MEKGLIFTYVTTYGGALVSLGRPYIGLLIYICFSIVRPEAMWYWAVPEGNYSRIIAMALLAGWAMNGFGNWQLGQARGVLLALLGFFFWSTISAAQAIDSSRSVPVLEGLAKIVLPFIAGITLIDSVQQLKQLVWVIVLSQGYVALEMNQAYFGGFNRVAEDGFGGMDNNCVAISMVTTVGVAFFLALNAATWKQKALAYGAAALMAHTVLLTFSRGGMIALIVTGLISLCLIRLEARHYLVLAVAALVGLQMAGPEVRQRFLSSFAGEEQRDASAQSRLELWTGCWDAMKKRPVFGVGPANWPVIVQEYGWPAGKEAHSLWFQEGAELGFPGILSLLGFYLLCVRRLFPIARRRYPVVDPWLNDAAAMVVAALVSFIVAAQFVTLLALEVPYYVTLIGAGVLKLSSQGVPYPVRAAQASRLGSVQRGRSVSAQPAV